MTIFSPMAKGNGAYVIHQILAENISNYCTCGYNPYWTLFPPALPVLFHEKKDADLVHTTPDYGKFFKRKGVPLVITFHNYVLDSFMDPYSSPLQRIHYKTDLRYFTFQSLRLADAVTSVSKFTAMLVQQHTGYTGKIKTIYNGIDTSTFRPKHSSCQKGKIKVLFSGNLTKRKGADLIPLIAQQLDKNIEILCTSGLRTRNTLDSVHNVRNIGSIPYSDMPAIYQQADILLFPTVREGFGLAVAEAMACGLPVVTTNCSSLPELIVHGKGGYLCGLGNVKEFASRLNQLADSPKLRQEMGDFNRERVEEKFTLKQMVKEYKKLFEKILG